MRGGQQLRRYICVKDFKMKELFIQNIGRIALLLLLMTTIGCNRRSAVDKKMDIADSLMTSKPDSALAILESISASDINGKKA